MFIFKMMKIAVLFLAAGVGVRCVGGQIPPAIPPVHLFSLPTAELRPKPESVNPDPAADSSLTLSATASNEARVEEAGRVLARYQWMNQTPALTRMDPTDSSPLERAFEPAAIKLGKLSLSGGLITAIKRLNPLCLLNPSVLSLDW